MCAKLFLAAQPSQSVVVGSGLWFHVEICVTTVPIWRKQKLNTLRLNLLQSKVARVAVLLYIQVNDEGEDNRPKTMRESWLVAGRLRQAEAG